MYAIRSYYVPEGANVYHVRVRWGQAFLNPNVETDTAWDGTRNNFV